MHNAAWAVLLLPLFGFVVLALNSRLNRQAISLIGPGTVGLAFVTTAITFFWLLGKSSSNRVHDFVAYTWIVSANFKVEFGIFVDPLATTLMLIITGVGFLILVYSIGYMWEDADYRRYFAYMDLFVFEMLLLVLSDNYLLLLIGWAGVGLTSYLLIGFWYDRPSAVFAARQALVVNVIGDWGMMIAAFLLFRTFGTLQYADIFPRAHSVLQYDGTLVRGITLLLLLGAIAKSAQLPLHIWLPNAMEGPTPVSALIHAATMVTAGVYLVARSYPLYHIAPFSSSVVVIVGALTAFFAATIGLANNDIKRVLAYSTISQIAYMIVGVGSAAYWSGIFHLTTHAYFKACLFMGAGAVMHALHDNTDIRRMGGLKQKMPITFWSFLIATLAISGMPPFSGFFSKDEIIGSIYAQAGHIGWLWFIWILLVITAGLTALYMFRLFFLVFLGESRDPELAEHAHDPPMSMRVPMVILAVLSIIGGYWTVPSAWNTVDGWLRGTFEYYPFGQPPAAPAEWASIIAAFALMLVGIWVAYRLYYRGQPSPVRVAALAPWMYQLFLNRWYVDELYDWIVVRPIKLMGQLLSMIVERRIIDAIVDSSGQLVRESSLELRRIQSGYVRNYALTILLGAVLVVGYYVLIKK
jgi:NADH-quinone oxidoreductase subunit L